MIDLHSHLLPAVDDGSRSVEQSITVLRAMRGLGVTDICLTPHIRASRADAGPPDAHERAFEALRSQAGAEPRLHRGAEVMLDQPLTVDAGSTRAVVAGLAAGQPHRFTVAARNVMGTGPESAPTEPVIP